MLMNSINLPHRSTLLTVEALSLTFSHFEAALLPGGEREQVPHLLIVYLQHAE